MISRGVILLLPTTLALLLLLALTASQGLAHAPVQRQEERFDTGLRLFIADSDNHQIVVLDLPAGDIITRISVPPELMSMGPTRSGRYLIASRGRTTDRPYVTVIDTGRMPGEPGMRLPVVAKTLLLGESISGPRIDGVKQLHERHLLVSETEGHIMLFDEAALDGAGAFQPASLRIAPPDHYHIGELSDGSLLVGMTRNGGVTHFDQSGNPRAHHDCDRAHGVAQARKRVFFGCRDGVLVFQQAEPLTRITNPGDGRAASFYHGDGVLFAGSENSNHLIRIDLQTLEAHELTFSAKVERYNTSDDGRTLLILLRNGELHVHDGHSGKHRHRVPLSTPLSGTERTTAGATDPSIAIHGQRAFITLPHAGEVVAVDFVDNAELTGRWQTGGRPTRLVIVER